MLNLRVSRSLLLCLVLAGGGLGCTTPPTPQADSPATITTSPTAPSPAPQSQTEWTTLLPGDQVDGLQFSDDRALLNQGQELLAEIPVSYVSDGTVVYAERLIVSPASPSANFNVVKACEGEAEGLCWTVYLVNKAAGSATQVTVGKYGGQEWLQWSADERYAVLLEANEGSSWIYAIDLQTGESKTFGEMKAQVDLASFEWLNDRAFQVNTQECLPAGCTEAPPFAGDLNDLFSAS